MTTKIQYNQTVISRSYDNAPEGIIINKPKSTKQGYSILHDNKANALSAEYGFIGDVDYETDNNNMALSFDRAIFNDGLIANISGGLYQAITTSATPPPGWGLNRFGAGNFLSSEVDSETIRVLMFGRNEKQIFVYKEYLPFKYGEDNLDFYDTNSGTLYISDSNPKAYGGDIWTILDYDAIYSSLLPTIDWAPLNNFQYVKKENNNTTVSLYSKYFPIYKNGAIAAKIGVGYVRIPNTSVTVDALTGIIIVDTSTSGYNIEDIDGFYIIYGAVPCIVSDFNVLSKNMLDVEKLQYATYLTVDNAIYTNAIVNSNKNIIMKRDVVATSASLDIETNNKNIYLEADKDISFSNQYGQTTYLKSESSFSVGIKHNEGIHPLRQITSSHSTSGLITVQLESHWKEELTDANWLAVMGTDTSGIALFGKFNDTYKLMSSDQYKSVTTPSLATTHSVSTVPQDDGYTLILNAWYDPSSLVIESNSIPLVLNVDYELVYPDTIVFSHDSLYKDEQIDIQYDVAVEPYIYSSDIDTMAKTVAYNQYKDIWTIYGSELSELYYIAAYTGNVYVGKITADGSKTLVPSQTTTVKVNTTSNYIKQLLTGRKGQY